MSLSSLSAIEGTGYPSRVDNSVRGAVAPCICQRTACTSSRAPSHFQLNSEGKQRIARSAPDLRTLQAARSLLVDRSVPSSTQRRHSDRISSHRLMTCSAFELILPRWDWEGLCHAKLTLTCWESLLFGNRPAFAHTKSWSTTMLLQDCLIVSPRRRHERVFLARTGCSRFTYDGKPGYCGLSCKAPTASREPERSSLRCEWAQSRSSLLQQTTSKVKTRDSCCLPGWLGLKCL
eukprot:6458535-Amphidinium_carterae.1